MLHTDVIVESITKALSGVLKDMTSTSDFLRVGVGLGGSQGILIPSSCDPQIGRKSIPGKGYKVTETSVPSIDVNERIATQTSHDEKRTVFVPQLEVPKDVDTPKYSKQESPIRHYHLCSNFKLNFDEMHTVSFAVTSTRVLRRVPSLQEKDLYSHCCKPSGTLESVHMEKEWRLAGYNP